jgi:hypothetical protein
MRRASKAAVAVVQQVSSAAVKQAASADARDFAAVGRGNDGVRSAHRESDVPGVGRGSFPIISLDPHQALRQPRLSKHSTDRATRETSETPKLLRFVHAHPASSGRASMTKQSRCASMNRRPAAIPAAPPPAITTSVSLLGTRYPAAISASARSAGPSWLKERRPIATANNSADRRALQAAGVDSIDENAGGAGLRLN